jgi:hypothetical protein
VLPPSTATDLEGDEFEQDAVNLAAWQEAFQQHHYWAMPLGPALAVGLSTVRFRSNVYRWDQGCCSSGMMLIVKEHRAALAYVCSRCFERYIADRDSGL